jgi:hypothetical protein
MVATKVRSSKLLVLSALALLTPMACSDTKVSQDQMVSMTSQKLQDGLRPPLEQFMKDKEDKRKPRPALPPKTEKAKQKLAEFQQRLAEKKEEWDKLPPEERELKQAKLKHELLAVPALDGGK